MKDLIWVGTSKRAIMRFPTAAKQVAGYQLHLIQTGMEPTDWKPMTQIGPGVREVRIHQDGEFRIIYLAAFEEGVYILHAFQKKTQKTSKKDIDLAVARLKDVQQQRTA